jgi:hypothetical protein
MFGLSFSRDPRLVFGEFSPDLPVLWRGEREYRGTTFGV